ncbi:MAG: dihydroneopterin aldolase [Culturomica sp.]|jgi:dihydroneopterin aldolase|nr:dihydroneopterin aldolase [Culturomica sp.]
MKGIIEIEDMEFFAGHGCFETERKVGNKFKVQVCLHYNCEAAANSDNIEDALNYQEVYEIVDKEMKINSNLLENVAKRIMDSLSAKFPQLEYARIKVSKLNPPLAKGSRVGCTSVCLEHNF